MRLREWVRRGRVTTTPPEAIPLVVIGPVASLVAQLAIGFFGSLVLAIGELFVEPSYFWHPRILLLVPSQILLGVLMVLGWRFVRRLVAGWFRRQPPEPPRGPMTG
jgi:hypothetical protein